VNARHDPLARAVPLTGAARRCGANSDDERVPPASTSKRLPCRKVSPHSGEAHRQPRRIRAPTARPLPILPMFWRTTVISELNRARAHWSTPVACGPCLPLRYAKTRCCSAH
jgi:hypothetical protein